MNIKSIFTTAAVFFLSSDKTCLGAKVGNLRGLEMGEGQDGASMGSSIPLVPTVPFFDSIKGDWNKDGEWRVHMSRSSKCTLTGESGPYPFGEYYCHRGTTPTTKYCVSGPNDKCKCWIFPVCTKDKPKCSSGVSNGQHRECHVLIERPTGFNNTVLQENLSATNWNVYNYSPDLSF